MGTATRPFLGTVPDAACPPMLYMLTLHPARPAASADAAEIVNTRIAYYSLASLLVCVLSGLWQLWYLRRFFQRKKLL